MGSACINSRSLAILLSVPNLCSCHNGGLIFFILIKSFTTEKQTTKFSSAIFQIMLSPS